MDRMFSIIVMGIFFKYMFMCRGCVMTRSDSVLGIILIVIGVVLLIMALSPLIFPVMLVLLAFYLINYGMKLRRMPPLIVIASSWWSRFGR